MPSSAAARSYQAASEAGIKFRCARAVANTTSAISSAKRSDPERRQSDLGNVESGPEPRDGVYGVPWPRPAQPGMIPSSGFFALIAIPSVKQLTQGRKKS